jgi:hypothetical protein
MHGVPVDAAPRQLNLAPPPPPCAVACAARRAANRPAEDVSARLVVDGLPYRESVASFAQLSKQLTSGLLERDLVLALLPGAHTVTLQVGGARRAHWRLMEYYSERC